jgi:ABC-type Mn2+/Zn2+ transport system permease subunit
MIQFFQDAWSQEFMRRALVGGALIGFTNGFLGAFIVLRRMSLMADALSHSMLPGLVIGLIVCGGLNAAGLFIGGIFAALFVALGAMLLARVSRLKEDTSLALLYTFAFSVGAVLLKYTPTRVDLNHYLFGNVLGMSNADLWISYGVALIVVPGLLLIERPLVLTLFDPAVARSQGVNVGLVQLILIAASVLTMISSAQGIGVILMLGLLVGPAATMYLMTDHFPRMMWGGGIIGLLGAVSGLLVSYRFDGLPSGAAIVIILFAVFVAALIFSPRYGLIRKLRKSRHFHEESLSRWEEGTEKHG